MSAPSLWRDALLPMGVCKRQLARLWLVLGLLALLLLLLRTLVGAYGGATNAVWSWFLPNIMPTLMLIVGVLVVDDAKRRKATEEGEPEPEGSGFLFRLAYSLSLVHLGLLIVLIVMEAAPGAGASMSLLTERTGYLTGPLQGLIAAALGAFFTR